MLSWDIIENRPWQWSSLCWWVSGSQPKEEHILCQMFADAYLIIALLVRHTLSDVCGRLCNHSSPIQNTHKQACANIFGHHVCHPGAVHPADEKVRHGLEGDLCEVDCWSKLITILYRNTSAVIINDSFGLLLLAQPENQVWSGNTQYKAMKSSKMLSDTTPWGDLVARGMAGGRQGNTIKNTKFY